MSWSRIERHGSIEAGPEKSQKDNQKLETTLLRRQVAKAGVVESVEEKAP